MILGSSPLSGNRSPALMKLSVVKSWATSMCTARYLKHVKIHPIRLSSVGVLEADLEASSSLTWNGSKIVESYCFKCIKTMTVR